MSSNKRILISKEDVWSNGKHWMSSASRDIYEHFYKSIKSTFLHQFEDPKIIELVERIVNVRKWDSECSKYYYQKALDRVIECDPPIYIDKRIPLDKEIEYFGEDIVEQKNMTHDPRIYKDFKSFFKYADHGWDSTKRGEEICLELYNLFIQDINIISLQNQLDNELEKVKNWNKFYEKSLIKHVNDNIDQKWFRFLSDEVSKNKDLNL
jgi:hypothetical protein